MNKTSSTRGMANNNKITGNVILKTMYYLKSIIHGSGKTTRGSTNTTRSSTNTMHGSTNTMHGSMKIMQGSTNTMQGSMKTMHGSTNTMHGSMKTMQGSMKTMHGSMKTMHGSTNTMQGSMKTMHGSMKTMQGSTKTMHGSTNTMQGSMKTMQGSTKTMQGSMKTMQGSTKTMQGSTKTMHGSTRTKRGINKYNDQLNNMIGNTTGLSINFKKHEAMKFVIILMAWMMKSHENFFNQIKKTITFLSAAANRTRLGFEATHPNGEWLDTVFMPAYTAYINAYNEWNDLSKRTPRVIIDLNDSEDAVRKHYATLRDILNVAPYVNNSDLLVMELPGRTSGRKPGPVAELFPVISVNTGLIYHLIFLFFSKSKDGKLLTRRHAKQHGIELCWKISSAPVVNVEELTRSSFTTRMTLDLGFKGEDRGKMVYFAARWENNRGEKGPWSPIEFSLIP
ncbi:MAG: hypothetical protein LBD64_04625 [Odoribacteraceae bacterium]|jgi:hypothetical protein|nr:hypothetical protein [Odoribacteraceae bacterium]